MGVGEGWGQASRLRYALGCERRRSILLRLGWACAINPALQREETHCVYSNLQQGNVEQRFQPVCTHTPGSPRQAGSTVLLSWRAQREGAVDGRGFGVCHFSESTVS